MTRYTSVDDVGRCINPLIVDGQTHGAIVQGVGQALWEQCAIDASGQPLCGSFMAARLSGSQLVYSRIQTLDQQDTQAGALSKSRLADAQAVSV